MDSSFHELKHDHICDRWGKTLQTSSGLRRHAIQKHDQDRRNFACDVNGCTEFFYENAQLRAHMCTKHGSNLSFNCDACVKQFSKKENLTRHLEIHAPRTLRCMICQQDFNRSDNLKQHMLTVHENKSHGCPICGKSYRWKTSLIRHRQNKHCETS